MASVPMAEKIRTMEETECDHYRSLGEGYKRTSGDSTDDMEIAIGEQDFRKLIRENGFFADKSLLIREMLKRKSSAYLITRPRRFGKSLGLSMIDCFFNVRYAEEEAENDSFTGLRIEQCPEYGMYRERYRNRYPVIRMSFTSIRSESAEAFGKDLRDYVSDLALEDFRYLATSDALDDVLRSRFERIQCGDTENPGRDFQILCMMLKIHHGIEPILLIDEYDKPLSNTCGKPFFREVAEIYGSFMESIVKDNRYLSFTVMTGVQRIVTDGIASGLNHVHHCSVLSSEFAEHFGLTSEEVEEAIQRQTDDTFPELSEDGRRGYAARKLSEAKDWYDGYRIGGCEIFNPWSITRFVDEGVRRDKPPVAYWCATSKDDTLVEVLSGFGPKELEDITDLYTSDGTPPFEEINPATVIWSGDRRRTFDDVVSLLVSCGYLTTDEVEGGLRIRIPNREVRKQYDVLMRHVYCSCTPDAVKLMEHIIRRDAALVKKDLEDMMKGGAYLDGYDEYRYKSWLRMVFKFSGYRAEAEKSTGEGRSDLFVHEHNRNPPILIEIKVLPPESGKDLSESLKEGTDQIIDQKYIDECMQPGVIALAVAFKKTSCEVEFLNRSRSSGAPAPLGPPI